MLERKPVYDMQPLIKVRYQEGEAKRCGFDFSRDCSQINAYDEVKCTFIDDTLH